MDGITPPNNTNDKPTFLTPEQFQTQLALANLPDKLHNTCCLHYQNYLQAPAVNQQLAALQYVIVGLMLKLSVDETTIYKKDVSENQLKADIEYTQTKEGDVNVKIKRKSIIETGP